MKVCSFDIGVRNFCCGGISYDPDTDAWDIDFWLLIDLYTGRTFDETRMQCSAILKNKKQCSSQVTIPVSEVLRHAPTYEKLLRKKKDELEIMCGGVSYEGGNTKSDMAQHILTNIESQISSWSTSSLMTDMETPEQYICKRHMMPESICGVASWDDIGKRYHGNGNRRPPESDIILQLLRQLDRHINHFMDVSHFRIESQTFQKYATIGAAVNAWLHMRLVIDHGLCIDIRNMHAFKKMCVYDGPAIPPTKCTKKTAHDRNKWFAIQHVSYILSKHPRGKELIDMFEKHPKKDDLADVLLMCLYTAQIEICKTHKETAFFDTREKRGGVRNVVMQSRYKRRGRAPARR